MTIPRAIANMPSDTTILLEQVRTLVSSPDISANAVSGFMARKNESTGAVDVTFTLSDSTGVSSVTLLRSAVMDANVAALVQSWMPATEGDYAFPDSAALGQNASAFYYLSLAPQGTTGSAALVGPVQIALNPDTSTPAAPTSLFVSHGAAANGTVRVYANVAGPDFTGGQSVRIYVAGYQGNAGQVLVASSSQSPLSFTLLTTGETVTVTARTVSTGGVESADSAAQMLTLTSAPTPPPAPLPPVVNQQTSGNQVSFQSSPDPSVTSYMLYRGQRIDTPSSATVLATITATSAAVVNYLDTGGLGGDFAYYVAAVSPAGTSAKSGPGSPIVIISSASLPPNSSAAVSNNAKVDSVSSAGSALIRVYGPGGVGTGFTYYTGAAQIALPNGTINGCSYKTQYAVVYDTVAKTYLAFLMTQYPSTLPDNYRFIGYHTTVSTGSASGSGATATAVIDGSGHVVQVNANTSGSGYDNAEVDFSGGGGSDAQATANISSAFTGKGISSITVTNGGSGYTTPPTVTIVALNPGQQTGGGGSSAIYTGGARYDSNPTNVNSG